VIETIQRKQSFDMVHDAQEMFRILLEVLANPGRVLDFRPQAARFAGQGRWLVPALTLLDKGTGFFWDGDRKTGDEIRFLTGAPRVSLEEADFVFLSHGGRQPPGPPGTALALQVLSRVKGGTHLDPHRSALLFIDAEEGCGKPGEGGTGARAAEQAGLRGPGIPPEGRRLDLFPAEALWCRARDERGFEYPCGVELVFLRGDDTILAFTRKTAFLWDGLK
jgi:alpha-D-ribose 1-methylphosphonate 5-triphosphate synthase subunit PhnH